MFIVMLVGFITNAKAYTFDGLFDPIIIFSYEKEDVEKIASDLFIVSYAGEEHPKCVVACIKTIQSRLVIIAYAFYKDGKLKHYLLIKGHYTETFVDANTTRMLEKKLNKLHGIIDI